MQTATEAEGSGASSPIKIRGHMPPLDGIRGVAILTVLVFHIMRSLRFEWEAYNAFTTLTQLGWIGVDLFFVLSGFLITGILYDSKGEKRYFGNFYARRALRIFPLYYLGLFTVMAVGVLWPELRSQGNASQWWVAVYATNLLTMTGGPADVGWLGHYWSLAVEEHYYLVWPAVVFFLNRRGLMWVAAAAMVIAFVLRVTQVTTGEPFVNPLAHYVLTPARMDSLAAGSMLALLVRGPRGAEPYVKPAFVLAAVMGLALCAIIVGTRDVEPLSPWMSSVGFTIAALFFAPTILVCLSWRPAQIVASLPILRWFGKYSYGMYVWHPIIFMAMFHTGLARSVRGEDTFWNAAGSVTLACIALVTVSLASWHLWEKQFLKLKHRFSASGAAETSGFAAAPQQRTSVPSGA